MAGLRWFLALGIHCHYAAAVDDKVCGDALDEAEAYGDGHGYCAVVVVGLVDYAGLQFFDHAHDVVHVVVAVCEAETLLYETLCACGSGEGLAGGGAVCYYESAGAELDASEIAYDDYEDVAEVLRDDLPQDGFACCAAGLAVVVAAVFCPFGTEAVCPAYVACVVVFFLVLCYPLQGFFGGLYGDGKGEELTP